MDEFQRFQAEMQRRAQETMQAETPTNVDVAVVHAMSRVPLKPGQMLLLGPKSVAILSTPGTGKVRLPDMHILDRSDWAVVKKASHRRR